MRANTTEAIIIQKIFLIFLENGNIHFMKANDNKTTEIKIRTIPMY